MKLKPKTDARVIVIRETETSNSKLERASANDTGMKPRSIDLSLTLYTITFESFIVRHKSLREAVNTKNSN